MTVYNDELCHWGILGMKWGVRRYQNKDGTLTAEGLKRYRKDYSSNKNAVVDANRWVKEDIKGASNAVGNARNLVRDMGTLERQTRITKKKKVDLSSMTDQQMREEINRKLLEEQYARVVLGDSEEVSRGREKAQEILGVAGSVLGVTSSALAIALAIQELKGAGDPLPVRKLLNA